jgi:transposase
LLNDIGRRRSLSNNDINKALEMLQSGLSCRNVAGTFGIAPSTISRVFNRFNATFRV